MNHRRILRSAFAFVATLMLCGSAQAQLFRAYLASDGNDANPCTLPAPCRLLPAALTAVASGGEIWMLDSANYNTGQVEVTKSVAILAIPGALGSVVATGGGHGLNINTAGVKVTLRNLVIVQLTSGNFGVNFAQGAELNISHCEIGRHPGMGGAVSATAASGKLTIKESVLRNSNQGLYLNGTVVASLDHVRIENNATYGISGNNNARLTISNSVVSGNNTGIYAYAGTSTVTHVLIDHTEVTANFSGIHAQTFVSGDIALVTVLRSAVTHNATGIQVSQGLGGSTQVIVDGIALTNNSAGFVFDGGTLATVYTRTNNTVRFNFQDISGGGMLTPLAAQ